MNAQHWSVDIYLNEDDNGGTHAEARLHSRDATHVIGRGEARLNPLDRNVPEIGDELAVARALSELSHRLLLAASEDIEQFTHEAVQLKH